VSFVVSCVLQLHLIVAFLGVLRCTVVAPLDRISVLMRAGTSIHVANNAGVLAVAKSLIKEDGIRSLWKSNGLMCMGYAPEAALIAYLMTVVRPYVAKDPKKPTLLEKFLTGGTSAVLAMTAFYPNYCHQTRLALSEMGQFNGALDLLRKTIRQDGWRNALFTGYTACMLRRFPETGINCATYTTLKEMFVPADDYPTITQALAFGSITSFIRCSVVYPLFTVQTKLMAQGASMGRTVEYTGIIDCFHKIVFGNAQLKLKPMGVAGLYKGWYAYVMKMVPAVAIEMCAIELSVRALRPYTG